MNKKQKSIYSQVVREISRKVLQLKARQKKKNSS